LRTGPVDEAQALFREVLEAGGGYGRKLEDVGGRLEAGGGCWRRLEAVGGCWRKLEAGGGWMEKARGWRLTAAHWAPFDLLEPSLVFGKILSSSQVLVQ
jgi:hypothetical protein